MKVIQISDFHVSKNIDIQEYLDIFKIMWEKVLGYIYKNEAVVICICGDIFDNGDMSQKEKIKNIIQFISNLLNEHCQVEFVCVPGNHDLENKKDLSHFCELMKEFCPEVVDFLHQSVVKKEIGAYDFILCNTASKGIEYGFVNIEELKKVNTNKTRPKIVVLHHALLSVADSDCSPIRNAYNFLDGLSLNTVALMHGHTHGFKNMFVNRTCQLVGVGPLFKEIPDVNKQLNLVEIDQIGVLSVRNFRYSRDLKGCEDVDLYQRNTAVYSGLSIDSICKKIVRDVEIRGTIHNLYVKIKLPYKDFHHEINNNFSSFLPIAENWQKMENPKEELYYNHGEFMSCNGKHGIEYIIEELKNKSSSNRAIIPLINFKKVFDSGDGFLPSFDVVQFGFDSELKKELIIALYLRALEVNHFLKINICELFLLCEKIKNEIKSVDSVELNIFAFCAHFKKKFGCFQKAKIDVISEGDIVLLLRDNEYKELIRKFEEKKDFFETVAIDTGFRNFKSAINSLIKKDGGNKWEEFVKCIDGILAAQKNLINVRKQTSSNKETNSCENSLINAIDEMITLLKGELQ